MSRKKMIAGLFLVLILSACGQPADSGSNTEPVQPALASPVALPEAVLLEDLPQSCQPASPIEISYQNVDFGYCMLFPSTVDVNDINPDFVIFRGLPASEGPEPLQAMLLISAGRSAEGQSVSEIVDGVIAEVQSSMPALAITRTATILSGEPAELVEGLPGRTGDRQLYAVHNDRVFQLLVSPVDPDFPQVQAEVAALWELALRSFAFLR